MYYTPFFMIFWAGHNGDSNVHDLQNFAWPFCMILHDLAYFVMYTPTYQTKFFMIFWAGHNGDSNVHDLHDFAWLFLMTLHDFAFYLFIVILSKFC